MALVERLQRTIDASHWQSSIPLNYRYTAGRAGQRFLTHLRDTGELLATRCDDCGLSYVPPLVYCERCLARLEDSYASLPARGTVHAFTICHESYDGTRKEEPSIVAMIRIEGSDGGLLHWLGGVDAGAVEIGMRVAAVLRRKAERRGTLLDIAHFEPAG